MTIAREGLALVLNCGSSSIKYQLIDTRVAEPLALGLVERVTDHAAGVAEVIANLEASARHEDPLPLLLRRAFGSKLMLENAVRTWATVDPAAQARLFEDSLTSDQFGRR